MIKIINHLEERYVLLVVIQRNCESLALYTILQTPVVESQQASFVVFVFGFKRINP